MKMMSLLFLAGMLAMAGVQVGLAAPLPVETFIKRQAYRLMKISPTGEFLAVSVPLEDSEAVTILNRKGKKISATMKFAKGEAVDQFWWASDQRLVVSNTKQFGSLARPWRTGELFAISADGSNARAIFGYRGGYGGSASSGRSYAWAEIIDLLDDSEDQILINSMPMGSGSSGGFSTVYRLNINNAGLSKVLKAPVRNANFLADNNGTVRYAIGLNAHNRTEVHYRVDAESDWMKTTEFAYGQEGVSPIGFSRDNQSVYQIASHKGGPSKLYRLDLVTGKHTLALQDAVSDVVAPVMAPDMRDIVGIQFQPGRPTVQYMDENAPYVLLHKGLRKSFGGDEVEITSFTKDGREAVVRAYSDRNPGDYYIVDLTTKQAEFVASVAQWIDPALMAERKPIVVKVRDGLDLHGYLTLPPQAKPVQLPMVVLPHGGPHGSRDDWGYDAEAQLLANRGYAVLQINFRGSGGYGLAFETAGHRQWGRKMQDDLTDATRWAIEQKLADPGRICIYGASYGGYAALMGAMREPDLYRCAVSYVGVTDLALMYGDGDIERSSQGEKYLEQVLGTNETELSANSPVNLVNRLKAPLLIVHGGKDERVPLSHAKALRERLDAQGKTYEWLVKDNEAHGFYSEANQKEFYERLLGFLEKHIGKGVAQVAEN